MIVCFSTCTDSIRTIPVLQHDPDKPEDLDTEAEDHAADEWRYACMSRPYIPKIVKEVKKIDTGYRVKTTSLKQDDWVNY
jgi:nitrate reductase beta subunit